MKVFRLVVHLFFPHESNNQKAKLLHNSSLSLLIVGLIFYQLFLSFLPKFGPTVLGYAANISPDEVVRLTNEKRASQGLTSLEVNSSLAQAAQAKGLDMLDKGYWAHTSPDGTQPWKFFADFGYKYRFAGENLARDFSNASSAVDAWMASPTHKENLLSPKYKEIGIAVVEGKLAGVETTIIVQFFGTKYVDTIPAVPVAQAKAAVSKSEANPTPLAVSSSAKPPSSFLMSPFGTTRNISLAIVAILLLVLVVDGMVTSRRAIVRISGRTSAHFAFLGMIAAVILILKAGRVL